MRHNRTLHTLARDADIDVYVRGSLRVRLVRGAGGGALPRRARRAARLLPPKPTAQLHDDDVLRRPQARPRSGTAASAAS